MATHSTDASSSFSTSQSSPHTPARHRSTSSSPTPTTPSANKPDLKALHPSDIWQQACSSYSCQPPGSSTKATATHPTAATSATSTTTSSGSNSSSGNCSSSKAGSWGLGQHWAAAVVWPCAKLSKGTAAASEGVLESLGQPTLGAQLLLAKLPSIGAAAGPQGELSLHAQHDCMPVYPPDVKLGPRMPMLYPVGGVSLRQQRQL